MDVDSPTALFPHKIMEIGDQMNGVNGTNGVNNHVNGVHTYPPLEKVVLPPLGIL
jgi:hypothetical protein